MIIWLTRTYFPEGTNGIIRIDGKIICRAIELPWHHNLEAISCIPEGQYVLKKRFSRRHKWHLEVNGVPNRNLILIHPANHAIKELNGCIAPVLQFSGAGMGLHSRAATKTLYSFVNRVLDNGKPVILIVES